MNYDVVVVGAGPSGSTAAKTLAERGINVLLVDKERFPREKPCGGGLPLRTLTEFPYIRKLDAIESYSYGGFIHSAISEAFVEINKTEPVIAMVQRSKFDTELVQLSIDQGTEFQENKKVTSIKILQHHVELMFQDESTATAELIIGADGYHSTVARKTHVTKRNIGRGLCLLQKIPVKRELIEEIYTKKLLCHIFSKFHGIQGYGWVFPKKDHMNIGIVSYDDMNQLKQKNINLRTLFTDFLETLKERNLLPDYVQHTKMKGGVLPLYPIRKTYANRILISGDAAGLINPITGEGIYYAICSGRLAGMTAAESIKQQDTSERFLSTYQKRWKQSFGKDINLFLLAKKQWGKQGEKTIQLMNKDPLLAEQFFSIFIGKESVYDLRWKIMKRYLYNKLPLK